MLGAVFGALAGAVTVAGAGGEAIAASPPGRPRPLPDAVTLYRKLHLRSDDGLLFWWLYGPKIGQVGTTLTPLYQCSIGTIMRVRLRDDGGFALTQLELNVLFDIETGEPLEQWRNPYTGETLPVRLSPVGPATTIYRADNSRVLPNEIGGARLESTARTHPPHIVGDDIFLRDESVARVFTPGREHPLEINDLAVYHGSVANLSDPRVTVGDGTVFFAEVTSWTRWMNMGDRPGNLTSRLTGRKVRRYEDLPEAWRAQLARVAPKIAADPIAALDQPAAVFDR